MANIQRVRVALTGFQGGPGVSTFYALDGSALMAPLRAFYDSLKTVIPNDVQIMVESSGDIIDPATGGLTGAWVGVPSTTVGGEAAGSYAAPVGIIARWLTPVVADGHRLKGRTFIVPLAGNQFDTSGQPLFSIVDGLRVAAQTFVNAASPNFIIWHRPFAGSAATPGHPARPAHIGTTAIVTGSSAGTKAAVLRSRRD